MSDIQRATEIKLTYGISNQGISQIIVCSDIITATINSNSNNIITTTINSNSNNKNVITATINIYGPLGLTQRKHIQNLDTIVNGLVVYLLDVQSQTPAGQY